MRWDGTDQKKHVQVDGITVYGSSYDENHLLADSPTAPKKKPAKANTILRAPKGDYALAQINNDIYVVTIPYVGADGVKINVKDASKAAFPSRKLTKFGGQFPSWALNGKVVYWSLGNTLFRYDINQAEVREEEQQQAKEDKEEDDAAIAASETATETTEEEEDEIEDYQAIELDVIVKAKRAIAQGTLVLKNATIISMKGEEIIENGTVVIKNNRIQSVGKSIEVPAGAK